MKDFATLPYITGAFPDVEANNASSGSQRDGTPWNKQFADEIMGAFQALLDDASIPPSGSADVAGVSDILDSIKVVAGYPGEVVFWAGDDNFAGCSNTPRLLRLDGQIVTITSYQELVNATYIGDANNADTDYEAFYKCSDFAGLVRDIAGPYYKLPDPRGLHVRVLTGTGVAKDPDRLYRGLFNACGSTQNEAFGNHQHWIGDATSRSPTLPLYGVSRTPDVYLYTTNPGGSTVAYNVYHRDTTIDSDAGDILTDRYTGWVDLNDELRPANIAFHLAIRY